MTLLILLKAFGVIGCSWIKTIGIGLLYWLIKGVDFIVSSICAH